MEPETTQAVVLSRDQILAKRDLPRERVHVPEWGGDVFVREMTGAERDDFVGSTVKRGKGAGAGEVEVDISHVSAKLVIRTACDEHGTALFTPKDLLAVSGLSSSILHRLSTVARRLSGLDDEEPSKNGLSGPSDSSPIDSPAISDT